MPTKSAGRKKISLALQGGGSHSAFSWGVIDQLLIDGRLEIEAVSASSGGALVASVLAQGLIEGEAQARETLMQFWRKISIASSLLPLRMNVMDKFLGHVGIDLSPSSMALDYITRIFSPYQFNLFDINPLRAILAEVVDFDMLSKKSPVELFINATNARTGKGRIFTNKELTLDAVMASACLPFIFKTVEIDGEAYWDGSFSGSPALSPLTEREGTSDIVLVQVHPTFVEDVPTSAADILDRATELSFHSVLMHELKTIEAQNKTADKPVYLHCIESNDAITELGRASKLNADWGFLIHMHDLGVQAATDWLEANYNTLGGKSSFDVGELAA